MKSWLKELLCVGLSAAFLAATLPRVLLPPLASAQRVPSALRSSARRDAPAPSVLSIGADTAPEDASRAPLPESPDVTARSARRVRGSARAVAPSPLPSGLRYVDHHWVADMGVLPPPRVALAGVSIAPPPEDGGGEGYRVLSVDRLGLFLAAGIAPGDVLIGVNGMPLRSPDDALDAMSRLRGATRATFLFQRGAQRYQVPIEVVGVSPGRPLPL